MAQLFPLLYGASFLVLLVQAFRIMARGLKAVPRPVDPSLDGSPASADPAELDRTGRLTIHPELLDPSGKLVHDDLLTVRFSNGNEDTPVPPGAS
ncbi:DUF2973 domain-containing protein [Synechococcus sp. CS-1325]|uniref:DUF2973 domain-containing protein n=1 Tax=unclassified Synechococcus TaxID=2626047 RepID=UPI000DB8D306|nr:MULTISPECIES: DUF2973 domain-containing protein [unclassified Synechococcus]PZV01066.1 MAG: DUF2973 domain-containing protein [Cyanobium sp.]MCT0199742.1 DUF2973 domain-containing protein [Synechococcus sp. CS-1325]MCT0214238.1 DUF2973 domain-containing protein [Synechococcus sp. CS-1326]MCT0231293.1 DUF2973 domain-containing protein [Synechococcus sp. CS-1324]MCT0232568.1 DUF2973 domain-containing protein [Synechococcus sp. CS-1327]